MPFRFAMLVSLCVALVAVAAEIWLGSQAGLTPPVLLPLVIATGSAVLWSAIGLGALMRPREPAMVLEVPEAQVAEPTPALPSIEDTRTSAHAQRLDRIEPLLRILSVEREFSAAERRLLRAAERVERWEDVQADYRRFAAAADDWTAILHFIAPQLAPATDDPSAAEVLAGRDQLPATRNFSSEELRTALTYLVHRDRIAAAHEALEDYRAQLIQQCSI